MSIISQLQKGYRTDTPVTVKEYLKNTTLQGDEVLSSVKSRSEFIDEVDISFPCLWYMFNNDEGSNLKNYGTAQSNLDTTDITYTSTDENKHIPFKGTHTSAITLNKNIIEDLRDDFTISMWVKGSSSEILKVSGSAEYIKIANSVTKLTTTSGGNTSSILSIDTANFHHIVLKCATKPDNSKVLTTYYDKDTTTTTNIDSSYTFNYSSDTILLGASVEYNDLRIFNKALDDSKIANLYNVGADLLDTSGISLSGTDGHHTDTYTASQFTFSSPAPSTLNYITLCFWVNKTSALTGDFFDFDPIKIGLDGNRFYAKTSNTNKIYSNKIATDDKYYFITIVVENDTSVPGSHTLKLYVDNFPCIGQKFNTGCAFGSTITSASINVIEDLLIYEKILSDAEILDLYITDVKLSETTDNKLKSLSYLFYDHTTDLESSDVYSNMDSFDLILNSTCNLVAGAGGVTVEGLSTTDYKLKLPEASYGGYQDHINDLVVWYKFDKNPYGMLKNYGNDANLYGMIHNSGVAQPELQFSVDTTKFKILQLENNNKLDKIHILDTDLLNHVSGDSNVSYTVIPTSNINVDILLVGGGGGGGSGGSGGGGGDVEYRPNVELISGITYTFKVGKGGDVGNIGGPSEIVGLPPSVLGGGGGGGGGASSSATPPTASATSGGGLVFTNPSTYHPPLAPVGKGYSGGNFYHDGASINFAGGGGGAGGPGGDASSTEPGTGGPGIYYNITTLDIEYGKGGNSTIGVDPNLVAWYKFDDPTNVLKDSTDLQPDLIYSDAASIPTIGTDATYGYTYVEVPSGVPTGNNINLPDIGYKHIQETTGLTFSMRFKGNVIGLHGHVFTIGDTSTHKSFSIRYASFTNPTITAGYQSLQWHAWPAGSTIPTTITISESDSSYSHGDLFDHTNWFNIVVTIDNTDTWNVYIDNVNYGTYNGISMIDDMNSNIYFPRGNNLNDAQFADFRIYNKALSVQEVTNLYNDVSSSSSSGSAGSSSTPLEITPTLSLDTIRTSVTPQLVKDDINEIYYKFDTTITTFTVRETLTTELFISDGTDSYSNLSQQFDQGKTYTVTPSTPPFITEDGTSITLPPLSVGITTSSITGESLSYDTPTIIIRHSRLTKYEYGKGGDTNTTGNSGAIIIRYNYYDYTKNLNRVIIQSPGYLNPYSYVWRGDPAQPIDDSYISINNPNSILTHDFLSINFWLNRDTSSTSKDYIFSIVDATSNQELLGIGLNSNQFFINILGSEHSNEITNTSTDLHYSIEIDYNTTTFTVCNMEIENADRLNQTTQIVGVESHFVTGQFTPTITLENSNLYSREIKALIGDIYDTDLVDYELSPHGIEDFRIYNKSLQPIIPDVSPDGIAKYHTLFMSGYQAASATGGTVTVDTTKNINIQFYNLSVADGGIVKNIGNGTNSFDAFINNPNTSNVRIITNEVLNDSAVISSGKYGFKWNKVTNSFTKTMYNSGVEALIISKLEIDKDLINFTLEMKVDSIGTYPIELFNKNNDIVISLSNSNTLTIRYFAGKVKYIKEFTISELVKDTEKTFKITIDYDKVTLSEDSSASIEGVLNSNLDVWYQFDNIVESKNYSTSEYSNMSLMVESNVGFISSVSSDVDIDYASPYTYYTFFSGDGDKTFTVNSAIECDMLMVGGGGGVSVVYEMFNFGGVSSIRSDSETGTANAGSATPKGLYTWTKPSGVNEVTAYVWGAGGGGCGKGTSKDNGGAGGFVKATIDVSSTIDFKIVVGEGGKGGNAGNTDNDGGWGGGGNGVSGDSSWNVGSGGGLSGIFTTTGFGIPANSVDDTSTVYIIAGAGGAGGGGIANTRKGGGGGGGTAWSSENLGGKGTDGGTDTTDGHNGKGGTHDNTAPSGAGGLGNAGNGGAGTKFKGGNGSQIGWGAGGGAGWYGGGGGGVTAENVGAGGGGSSYWDGTGVTYIANVGGTNGSTSGPVTTTHTSDISLDIPTDTAKGGAETVTFNGGNGLIIIEYSIGDGPSANPGGGGGGEVLYQTITLQPGDYTVSVGDSGYDTKLSSNSIGLFKALHGNLNNGGNGDANCNAEVNILHGFKGGDGVNGVAGGGGGGMGEPGTDATATSGGKGGKGVYHAINPYGIQYEYGAGGNGSNIESNIDYSLYKVLPWHQQSLKTINDIVSFTVWNDTKGRYEIPTSDFVLSEAALSLSEDFVSSNIYDNYTGLYSAIISSKEYYLYRFHYVNGIVNRTFSYSLTATGDNTAYIFAKSHDRTKIIEAGCNIDITIYKDDSIDFSNEKSVAHPLAIKDSSDADVATDSGTITIYTFSTIGEYTYYCTNHDAMKGTINVIARPGDIYDVGGLIQTRYKLEIKRNVKVNMLLLNNVNYKEHTDIDLSADIYEFYVGDSGTQIGSYNMTDSIAGSYSSDKYTGSSITYNTKTAIIRFSKSDIENVLTTFGRGGNATQSGTPGLLVLRTDNSQIVTMESLNHHKLPYAYVWSGKTDISADRVLVKSTVEYNIPAQFTMSFWYYEANNNDVKDEIVKISDNLKVSTNSSNLVFTVSDGTITVDRPTAHSWNFYGLIVDNIDATLYINSILTNSTSIIAFDSTQSGNVTLGISSEGVAKIADFRIYDTANYDENIKEQYENLGAKEFLDIFGVQAPEYDNERVKGYLSINQNNIKTHIFDDSGTVTINYRFQANDPYTYYPIMQFTDYINDTVAPKMEIIMKHDKLYVSVMINETLQEEEYTIDCATLKSYEIVISAGTITVGEKQADDSSVFSTISALTDSNSKDLIALYDFKNGSTHGDTVSNLAGTDIIPDLIINNSNLQPTKIQDNGVDVSGTDIGSTYKYYVITGSGYMKFEKETRVDMVLVGGGAGGGDSGSSNYGNPGEVNIISTYLEGIYKVDIGIGGLDSNMAGSNSTITDMNTGMEIYNAAGGLSNIEYIDSIYSNLYTSYDFGDGSKDYGGYGMSGGGQLTQEPSVVGESIVGIPDYENYINTLQHKAELVTEFFGWKLVRFLPDGSLSAWHSTDHLEGTRDYGDKTNVTAQWSIEFQTGGYNQYLFANSDCNLNNPSDVNLQQWLVMNKDQFQLRPLGTHNGVEYGYNKDRTAIKSSLNSNLHTVQVGTDDSADRPLIALTNWTDGVRFYQEVAINGQLSADHLSFYVFVRYSTDTVTLNPTTYTHKIITLPSAAIPYNVNYLESTAIQVDTGTGTGFSPEVIVPAGTRTYSSNTKIKYSLTAPSISTPGSGGKTALPGVNGILALREHVETDPFIISRQTGYNLPYSYQWSGVTTTDLDKTYLHTTVTDLNFLNSDFIISFWCVLNNSDTIKLLSINSDNLDIKIDGEFLVFELPSKSGKSTTTIKRNDDWQHLMFVKKSNELAIYVNGKDRSKLISKPDDTSASGNAILYINNTENEADRFMTPFKISDLRIYKNSDEFIIKKLSKLPTEPYFYIGANQVTDIAPSILSDLKINNNSSGFTSSGTITYHQVNFITEVEKEYTIDQIDGNESATAYQWSNLGGDSTLQFSNLYMNVANSHKLVNKFYNGFEFAVTYWSYISDSYTYDSSTYDIKLSSTSTEALKVVRTDTNILQATLNITDNSNQALTVKTSDALDTNQWYLISVTGGISDKYLSLSIGAYDSNFTGEQSSYISGSALQPFDGNYNYNLDDISFYVSAFRYADVKLYNKFITLADIYNVLTDTSATISSSSISLSIIYSGSSETVNLISDITKTLSFATTASSGIPVNIERFYRIELSFSYSKNASVFNEASDFAISGLLKFSGENLNNLTLYSDGSSQSELSTYSLESNVWYDYFVTMKYDGTDTSGEIYIGRDGKKVYTNPYVFNGFIPFKGLLNSDTEIKIGIDDEVVTNLEKKIENINIFTKKLNSYMVKSLIENKATNLVQMDDQDNLEIWYRFEDFKDGVFTYVIKDSSGKDRDGRVFGSGVELKKTNHNKNSNSFKLLRNNFKAMKVTSYNFYIDTPTITNSLSEFTIMIKVLYEDTNEITLFTYGDLKVKVTNSSLDVLKVSTSASIITSSDDLNHTFTDNWTAVIVTLSNGLLSVYIDNKLKKRDSFTFNDPISNTVELLRNDSLSENITISLEDFRFYSKKVKYETIYEYVNGLYIA